MQYVSISRSIRHELLLYLPNFKPASTKYSSTPPSHGVLVTRPFTEFHEDGRMVVRIILVIPDLSWIDTK